LMCFARPAGMQAKAVHLGYHRNGGFRLQRRYAVKGQGLAARMRTDRNPVVDGCSLNLIEARSDLEVQIRIDRGLRRMRRS
jgi:hypothetical protein